MSESNDLDRYSRQVRFPGLGEEGQRRLLSARVTLCGCGALGSAIADGLVRAGVGFLRIVDRDFLELNNLQRQHLFDEDDLANHLPKAEAAARKLRRINSSVQIEAVVADFDYANIHALADDADLVLDGTDNFETRFLINDYCVKLNRPWVYGGCIGSQGQCMTIIPNQTPCFRCLVESAPPPGSTPTCESAGILSAISTIVANLQLAEAIKILSGNIDKINRDLLVIDVWDVTLRKLKLTNLLEKGNCTVCKLRQFDYLDGKAGVHTTSLCGRNAVQIVPPARTPLDWEALRARLAPLGDLVVNRFLMQATIDGYQFSIFPDGRAIIKGTDDVSLAKSLYARFLGG